MHYLRPIHRRTDARTRYLVEAGQLLAETHGWRIGVHFMLTYGVPPPVVCRLLERG